MSDEKHVYDDIVELDNQLPRWWLISFYLSILFAAGYYFYYELGNGPSLAQEYERERVALQNAELVRAQQGQSGPDEKQLLAALASAERRKTGHEVFTARCAACHGAQGQGGIGPNLTDDFWLHGGKPVEIARTITNGVLDKGMPPWGPMLKSEEIVSLVAYIKSIHDTHPPGAKAPQGVRVEE